MKLEIFTCIKCRKEVIFRDMRYYNHETMCEDCFVEIPEKVKIQLTCCVRGCQNKRRHDIGSEYCDFHLNERTDEIKDKSEEIEDKQIKGINKRKNKQ